MSKRRRGPVTLVACVCLLAGVLGATTGSDSSRAADMWVREWNVLLEPSVDPAELAEGLGLAYLGPFVGTNWHSLAERRTDSHASATSPHLPLSPHDSSGPTEPPSGRSGPVEGACQWAACEEVPEALEEVVAAVENSTAGAFRRGSSVGKTGLPKKEGRLDWAALGVLEVEQVHTVRGGTRNGPEPTVLIPDVEQWTPIDPLDEYWALQWHLRNPGTVDGVVAHQDINVTPAWAAGYKGDGVQIAVIDDGLAWTHPDFGDKFVAADSVDIRGGDDDPTPPGFGSHGTAVAGVAFAAEDEDGVCGVGVAPKATFSGVRLLGDVFTSAEVAVALGYGVLDGSVAVSVNSWGPADSGFTEYIGKLVRDTIRSGVEQGRGGLGTVYVWAGGNGGECDNSQLDPYTSLPETLAVGAIDATGVWASYSERGSNLLVNTPSSNGSGGGPAIATTRWSAFGLCRVDFGGTSAAAPMVGGSVALILEAGPSLTWRDVKWLLALSGEQNDPDHESWTINAAGLPVSEFYAHGRLNVGTAVTAVPTWPGIGMQYQQVWEAPAMTEVSGQSGLVWSSTVLAQWADLPGSVRNLIVEDALAIVSITGAPWRQRDVDILLESPLGTRSRVWHAFSGSDCKSSESTLSERAMYSTHFMGEAVEVSPGNDDAGWTLYVQDRVSSPGSSFLADLNLSWSLELRAIENPFGDGPMKLAPVGRRVNGTAACGDGVLEADEACEDPIDGLPSVSCSAECEFKCELPVVCGDGEVTAPCEQCDPPDGILCGPTCRFATVNDDPEAAFPILQEADLGQSVTEAVEFNNTVAQPTFGLDVSGGCGSTVLQADLWFYLPPSEDAGSLSLSVIADGWTARWFVWTLPEGLGLEDWQVKSAVPVACLSGSDTPLDLEIVANTGALIAVGSSGALEVGTGRLLVDWTGRCGNGQLDAGEECDPAAYSGPSVCRPDCTEARCGDWIVDAGEDCDEPSDSDVCCTAQCGFCAAEGQSPISREVLYAGGLAAVTMCLIGGFFVMLRSGGDEKQDRELAAASTAVVPQPLPKTAFVAPAVEPAYGSGADPSYGGHVAAGQLEDPVPKGLSDEALAASVETARIPSPLVVSVVPPERGWEEPVVVPAVHVMDHESDESDGSPMPVTAEASQGMDVLPPPVVDDEGDSFQVDEAGYYVEDADDPGLEDEGPLDLSLASTGALDAVEYHEHGGELEDRAEADGEGDWR